MFFRQKKWVSLAILHLFLASTQIGAATLRKMPATGPQPTVISPSGRSIPLYENSYALLIAESDYLGADKKGWQPLTNTLSDVDKLAAVLTKHGFNVWIVSNATGVELLSYFREFSAEYGDVLENRLLYFFTGHGHSDQYNGFGYVVPIDAPDPRLDKKGFLKLAIPIDTFNSMAHQIRSRHAMFVFDSCFSGTIFNSKGADSWSDEDEKGRWRFLTSQAMAPARQFITAGSANETVPAKSYFLPLLIDALNGRATKTGDGFVTGKEIGLWLAQTVPNHSKSQHPQSGMVLDPELARGDVTFQFRPPEREVSDSSRDISYFRDVYFDFDKAVLKPESRAAIDNWLEILNKDSQSKIIVTGQAHKAEQEGMTAAYGVKFATRRAESVKAYLVQQGISPARIYTEGKFVSSGETPADLSRVRRATLTLESPLR